MFVRALLTVAGIFVATGQLPAVILNGTADPSANTSAPTGTLANSGWQYEGQFGSFLGTVIASNYFITAKHIGGSVGDPFVFSGVTYTTIAVFPDPSSDLQVWKISGTFPTHGPLYANAPGLKVCTPATPRDAKGLLKTAVRDDNPVLVLEAELLYSSKGMVEPPDEELLIPLGQAELKREGSDVSIICYAQTVPLALTVAARLEEEDISAEIVDLRSIKPLDETAIFNSVAKTHRVVIVEQDRPFCGVGAEVCYRIQKNIFDELDAPIMRVSQEDVPMPYNERLEKFVLPNANKLMAAVKKVCYA